MQIAKLFFSQLLTLTIAQVAFAQQAPQISQIPEPFGYVSFGAGVEFDPPSRPVLSVEYGEDMHRNAQAYATFSYFENLMQRSVLDQLDAVATRMTVLTGTPTQFIGRDRALVFAAGGKYLVPTGGAFRPYVGGGAGVLNIRREVVEPSLGIVTGAVLNDFGIGEIAYVTSKSVTRPMIEGTVGIGMSAGHTYVDIGYRYRRAFYTVDTLDFSQFSAGVGARF